MAENDLLSRADKILAWSKSLLEETESIYAPTPRSVGVERPLQENHEHEQNFSLSSRIYDQSVKVDEFTELEQINIDEELPKSRPKPRLNVKSPDNQPDIQPMFMTPKLSQMSQNRISKIDKRISENLKISENNLRSLQNRSMLVDVTEDDHLP